jgi:hypothetical protein
MSYLFIKKISFEEKSFYYSHKKLKNLKKTEKNIFSGFFRWVFLEWVF